MECITEAESISRSDANQLQDVLEPQPDSSKADSHKDFLVASQSYPETFEYTDGSNASVTLSVPKYVS